jgi:hypothetical protein
MRLINARTYALEEFFENDIPPYAILSHVWEDEEVTFRDMQDIGNAKQMKGFTKIHGTCEQALFNGIDYAWVDTCKSYFPLLDVSQSKMQSTDRARCRLHR